MNAGGGGCPASPRPVGRGPFATDLAKYYSTSLGGSPTLARKVQLWLFDSDFHCVACFRFGQTSRALYARNPLLGLMPRVISMMWRRRLASVHHVNIDRRAQIGPGFYLMHRNGLFIGPVSIGANCVLHHNVTIGQRVSGGERGVPTLGDNVWVGPGSMISGEITIGNNVTISAGTVLSKSVPDGVLVGGNPGRVIQLDYDNRAMINFTMPPPGRAQLEQAAPRALRRTPWHWPGSLRSTSRNVWHDV